MEEEHKQVTVRFADLKGSMEFLADRDPEEARKILVPLLEHMMDAVHRYEGTVNRLVAWRHRASAEDTVENLRVVSRCGIKAVLNDGTRYWNREKIWIELPLP